jgi:hypothetical protein
VAMTGSMELYPYTTLQDILLMLGIPVLCLSEYIYIFYIFFNCLYNAVSLGIRGNTIILKRIKNKKFPN